MPMFPLLKIDARTLLVDDDETFVEAMSVVMPARLRGQFCTRPSEVDLALSGEEQSLEREQSLLLAMDPTREGPALLRALEYLQWLRCHEVFSVVVSDHAMPAESGVDLCSRHRHHGLRRILLTGVADVDVAISAFNRGAIEQFLPKQTPRLYARVVEIIDEHHRISVMDRGSCLVSFMSGCSREILSRPDVVNGLNKLLDEQGVTEYVTLGSPFGVMGARQDGSRVWIQIEEEASLPLLKSMAKDAGWNQPEICQIVSDRLLPNVDLVAQVDGVCPALAKAVEIADGVLVGVFSLPAGLMARQTPPLRAGKDSAASP